MSNSNWIFDLDPAGRGRVEHRAHPRFRATWTSGAAGFALTGAPGGLAWCDPGSGPEDSLRIFDVQWRDPVPDAHSLARLEREAFAALDAWIAARL